MIHAQGAILIVDDHQMIRDMLRRHLERLGHTVHVASDGREALALLQITSVDLVLLDLMMPGVDGAYVLDQIKGSPALRHIPVIMVSAHSDVEQVVSAIERGADDYLAKPFNLTLLNARVSAGLERKRLRDLEQAYLHERLAERTALAERRAEELAQSQVANQQQAAILESILASMGDGVLVVDAAGRLIHRNPAAEQIMPHGLQALLPDGGGCCAIVLPGTSGPCPPEQQPLARAVHGSKVDGAELVLRCEQDHTERWLSVTARPLTAAGGAVAVFRDVTAAKLTEMALRASEERYALAARGANDGLWDWDIAADRIFFSPRWKTMLGYEDHEIGTSPSEWFERIHPDDLERLRIRLVAHWKQLLSHFEFEYRILHRDGDYRWMLCRGLAVWDAASRATRMAGSQTEITERKAAEERLQHEVLHDALTGLPNRVLFADRLSHAIARARRNPEYHFAVLFLDLDRFKVVNDSLGHLAGDQLLVAIAERLAVCVRTGDTVARLGGDEFCVLLDDLAAPREAAEVAERIQVALAAPLLLDGQELFTSVSIGITLGSQEYQRPDDILRDADTAMYRAKTLGKARHVIFDTPMRDQALAALQLETDLRRAIERDELEVHYQPIVSLEDTLVVGFEALARWRHPQRGTISPTEFIPIAEETGQIMTIGLWVLREACRQMHEWHERYPRTPPLTINVNLSPRQFSQPDLVARIGQILRETGLNPRSLKLEVTESALIEQRESAAAVLDQLHGLGLEVAIDDFGTGYSSLSYLHRFPVDVLKIDRSFVSRLGSNGENSEIIQAIVALAQSLSISAVAEGMETSEQLAQLRSLNCDYGQGWLFARVLDRAAAEAVIAAQSG